MKRVFLIILIVLTSIGILFLCTDYFKGEKLDITLDTFDFELKIGESKIITANVNKTDKEYILSWVSTNPDIASIDNTGKVIAKSKGQTNIMVSCEDVSKTVRVTVSEIEVLSVMFNTTELSIKVDDTGSLIPIINPSNATNKTVTFTSSDNSILSVDNNGNYKGLKIGKATITVKTVNNKTASCNFDVLTNEIFVDSITLSNPGEMKVGDSKTITYSIKPDNATNKTITWSSNNTSVATVTNGVVKALKAGTVIITATSSNGKTSSVTINIKTNVKPVATAKDFITNNSSIRKEYSSDTLKYKSYRVDRNFTVNNEVKVSPNAYITYIWMKNPNTQMVRADGNGTVSTIINSVGSKYQNKQLIAFNDNGCINNNCRNPYHVTDGSIIDETSKPDVGGWDMIGISKDNKIVQITGGMSDKSKFTKIINDNGIRNTFEIFVVTFIENGKYKSGLDLGTPLETGGDPRQAICQLDENNYVMYSSSVGSSKGTGNKIHIGALARLFMNMGCINAFNFDGGGSTTMVIKDKGSTTATGIIGMDKYTGTNGGFKQYAERSGRLDAIMFIE